MPHMLVLEHVSPATRLLEKRRQMFEVQEVLEQQKSVFHRKEEVFKRQEDSLKKKDLDLQESLIKFSKFLQENDSKISRAEKKGKEEIALRMQKEAEIRDLQANLEQLKDKCDEVNQSIDQNVKYQRYLESVVEANTDLSDITDILNRHATLMATNSDLKQQQNDHTENMERVRKELQVFTKQRSDEILNRNNHTARLKKRLEALKLLAADEEAVKDSALLVASQNTLEYGQVITSTENLYNRVMQKSKTSHADEDNPLQQLEAIGHFIADLGHIIRLAKGQ